MTSGCSKNFKHRVWVRIDSSSKSGGPLCRLNLCDDVGQQILSANTVTRLCSSITGKVSGQVGQRMGWGLGMGLLSRDGMGVLSVGSPDLCEFTGVVCVVGLEPLDECGFWTQAKQGLFRRAAAPAP